MRHRRQHGWQEHVAAHDLGPGSARGSIRFEGQELVGRPAHAIPGLGIAHVPEGRHVFPEMSVDENVRLGAYAVRTAKNIAERRDQVLSMFPRLRERLTQAAGTLSGGEQQMVAIGRAMMLAPRLLLLDEPSHGLAPKIVDELHETFLAVSRTGTAILLVEQKHHAGVVSRKPRLRAGGGTRRAFGHQRRTHRQRCRPQRLSRPIGHPITPSTRQAKGTAMSESEQFKKGLEVRRKVLGKDYVDGSLAKADDFMMAFQEITTEWCWGYAWTRPGLSHKTRSMLNLAMLTALGKPNELKLHVKGALANGLTVDEIKEILLHATVYCGIPAASMPSRRHTRC